MSFFVLGGMPQHETTLTDVVKKCCCTSCLWHVKGSGIYTKALTWVIRGHMKMMYINTWYIPYVHKMILLYVFLDLQDTKQKQPWKWCAYWGEWWLSSTPQQSVGWVFWFLASDRWWVVRKSAHKDIQARSDSCGFVGIRAMSQSIWSKKLGQLLQSSRVASPGPRQPAL